MAQNITKGIQALTEEARLIVADMLIEDAKRFYNHDDYVFVDVREAEERAKLGVIPGAFTCPRGMLEFLIDPQCPVHNKIFNQDKTYVFYCAHGLRSLYAAKQAHEMGLASVLNMAGGFAAWKDNAGSIEVVTI
ncbi:rhodanese-like domain-containing protein [Photobacterium sanguinicancri]|uniref:rhodanese-like domain-containing protein n=1 Tax=Photobacterium sanguinicancri TaxID=875932 RepID=UPI0026E3ADC9|nr:rhodanese-like domain-containing protein [Photobacterium sanguinicancri]MDO6498230.1 rhodanese-like domain-containing protein [Photobacterium sanguinicancri]